jgi:ferric-dicitrate binding protein FerR (iron transport regulator)
MDPACGYSPGGFALRVRQVPYRDLIAERLPSRAQRDPEARLAWLSESIEQEDASLRAALKQVLRERHGRLSSDEADATGRAMAWCHLLAGRCQLRALREFAKAAHAELQRTRSHLTLF